MQIKNRILTVILSLCLIFTLCTPLFAEEPNIEVDFKMAAKPIYIYEMTSAEIIDFFKTATGAEILDPSQTTMEFGMMVIGDDYQLRDITVLSFKITDIKSLITDEEKDIEALEERLFTSVKDSLSKRSISSSIYAYDCDIKTEKINGKIENAYFHMALYLGDSMASFTSDVMAKVIVPKINDWKSLTVAEQILMLNTYMLNGQFAFDTELEERKSVVKFIKDGKGTSEDYAGLVGLFLDEMGLENIIVKGTFTNNLGKKSDHSWNMVKINGKWYHLDIFANGPIDEEGKHTQANETYILKATTAISQTHKPDKAYAEYTNAAKENYALTPDEENFNPSRPGLSDFDSEMNYLLDLLNAGFDILENHAEEYTAESIKNLTSVYTDCRNTYLKENVTVTEIRSAQKMLDTVISNLTKASAVNKEYLFYHLGKAYEMLYYPTVSVLYPAEALKELELIYNDAAFVYQNENATQSQVDSANWSLRNKVAELKALLEPDEPDTPTDPDTPVDPEGPTDPDNPTDPDTPADPENPTDPDTPADPENPTDPDTPVDPENPDDPTIPTDPDNPVDPVPPVDPNEPVKPDDPTPPTDPVQPEDPTTPTDPNYPNEPTNENKIPTDILIYGLLALVAAGGIIFLIVDGINKRKIKNSEEDSENMTSEADPEDQAVITPIAETDTEESETNEEKKPITDTDSDENKASEIKSEEQETETNETKPEDNEVTVVEPKPELSEDPVTENDSEVKKSENGTVVNTASESSENNKINAETAEESSEETDVTKEETAEEHKTEDDNVEIIAVENVCPIKDDPDNSIEDFKISAVVKEDTNDHTDVEKLQISQDETMMKIYRNITSDVKTEEKEVTSLIEELHKEANLKTSTEVLASELKNEEKVSKTQLKEDIKANQKTATDILKQIKKEKKEIKNNEKE